MKMIICGPEEMKMTKSIMLWSRARQGYPAAQFEVGEMYHHGLGVSPDPGLALAWYEKAAEQGHVEAQFRAGRLNYLGAPAVE